MTAPDRRLSPAAATLDHRSTPRSLDGTWQVMVDPQGEPFDAARAIDMPVPSLWEAQGHIRLDGEVLYRTVFSAEAVPHATLRFGAVMDEATVVLNGHLMGHHVNPFTPFECDVSGLLRDGDNELLVTVLDHVSGTDEHVNSPHGKQGWALHEFPSPPSLYITYGGIWQGVSLRHHGALAVRDLWFNSDHRDLIAEVELANVSDTTLHGQVTVTACGREAGTSVTVAAHGSQVVQLRFGAVDAARWSPASPALHEGAVEVHVDGVVSDEASVRFGLRVLGFDGDRLTIDGVPHRLKSALVQGFYGDTLYAEPSRERIENEVRQARDAGFNTLRLHIKAFDPVYLDVCDELGMLLQCDIPVAEPINHGALGFDGEVADRCAATATAQVRRDRNHPSIVLWAAMNELGLDSWGSRDTDGYEGFARRLYGTVEAADGTRPIIENDWVDADPNRVFCSPILTVHWYGRLDRRYLDVLDDRLKQWSTCGRPFLVNEFGDWGLPDMTPRGDSPFWWYGEHYARELGATPWPGTATEFAAATQRYMGMADRLQIELWRRHAFVSGWCLTELTDVPWEFNGVLDIERNLKHVAADHIRQSQQTVLAMLSGTSFTADADSDLSARLWVDNEGPALSDVTVEATLGTSTASMHVGAVPSGAVIDAGTMAVRTPAVADEHSLTLRVLAGGQEVGRSTYPVVVHPNPVPLPGVRVLGSTADEAAVAAVGAPIDFSSSVLVVGEDALDEVSGKAIRSALADGGTVVVLAQAPEGAQHYPVPTTIVPLTTEWGGTDFHFTTDVRVISGFPASAVLDVHDMALRPTHIISTFEDDTPWAQQTSIGLFKPMPRPRNGLILGASRVGGGRLIACQYQLVTSVLAGNAAARGVLHDVLAWSWGSTTP